MRETTPALDLPLMAAAQAQKHVTHNAALMRLDALTQIACLSRTLAAPPADPEDGACYLVPDGAGGAWSGWAGRVALRQDGAWNALAPRPGWLAWIDDEALFWVRGAAGWEPLAGTLTVLRALTRLGIGTDADAASPFAAKLNRALWTARAAAEGGDGSLLCAMNKEAAGRDVGLLLQTGYAARAMLGLFGDDDLAIKVSADGTSLREALRVGRADGIVRLPRLPRFSAGLGHDAALAADAWAAVPLDEGVLNDQLAFDPAANRFTAPVAGSYALGATLGLAAGGAAPAALLGRFARGGPPATTFAAARAAAPAPGGAAVTLAAFANLAAGETVALQAQVAGAGGALAAADTRFWGYLVG